VSKETLGVVALVVFSAFGGFLLGANYGRSPWTLTENGQTLWNSSTGEVYDTKSMYDAGTTRFVLRPKRLPQQ
jgi:hypothetical protein